MSEQGAIGYFAGVGELTAGLDGSEVIRGFLAGIKDAPFDPDAPLPDLHIPVRGLGIETVEEVEDDES